MPLTNRQVSLGRTTIACRCHVCAFVEGSKDELEVMLPFVAEGIARGERILQLLDPQERQDRMRLMIESGIDAEAAEQSGTLQLIDWDDTYLRGARFDPDAMLALVDQIGTNLAQAEGVGITRAWASMGWTDGEVPGKDGLAEYESRLNTILPNYDLAVVCAYDVTNLDVALFKDILRAHPYVIIGGVLRPNMFYVPPEQLLRELTRDERTPNRYC